MNRISSALLLFTLVALLLGGTLTRYYFRSQGPSLPVPEPFAAPMGAEVPPLNRPTVEATANSKTSSLPKISMEPSQQPGDIQLVPFEVVEDNLAVAYGDVILGQVPEGDDIARSGRYEPPAMRLWDSPEIPYAIEAALPHPERVEQAIAIFTEFTPVRFVRRTHEPDAIIFQVGYEHCYSSLGRTGGLQPVRLSPGCRPQEVIHELMHALGFVHEQSRPDRDQHIEVLWDNIEAKYRTQYEIVPDVLMEAARGTAFDAHSVMMYRPDTFAARPGILTMQARTGRPAIQPVLQGLSEGDISRIKQLFKSP